MGNVGSSRVVEDGIDAQKRNVERSLGSEDLKDARYVEKMASECPVDHRRWDRSAALDPRNQMPKEPNQLPSPGQKAPLSIVRTWSGIPKSGTDGTWLYPSPQMFFNALQRKGKGEGVVEEDMESVVYVHNTMNEKTWKEVQRWESMHEETCGDPKLQRFRGRPDELSPRARFWKLLGYEPPFDRHDWYVDRCGDVVRYVIDFYFDESKAGSPDAFVLDVRPGLDSFGNVRDRVRMSVKEALESFAPTSSALDPALDTDQHASKSAQIQVVKPASCPVSSKHGDH